jgi:hypothetical protein
MPPCFCNVKSPLYGNNIHCTVLYLCFFRSCIVLNNIAFEKVSTFMKIEKKSRTQPTTQSSMQCNLSSPHLVFSFPHQQSTHHSLPPSTLHSPTIIRPIISSIIRIPGIRIHRPLLIIKIRTLTKQNPKGLGMPHTGKPNAKNQPKSRGGHEDPPHFHGVQK